MTKILKKALIDLSVWYSNQKWLQGIFTQLGFGGVSSSIASLGEQKSKRGGEYHLGYFARKSFSFVLNALESSREFEGKLNVLDIPTFERPKLVLDGSYDLTDTQLREAEKIRENVFEPDYSDDPCAAVFQKPKHGQRPIIIKYKRLLYSEILALRRELQYVGIATANTLMICSESNELIVQERSHESADFPARIHTFGGAMKPQDQSGSLNYDFRGIEQGAARELSEETSQGGAFIHPKTPIIVIDEHHIQFMQTAFLGVDISMDQCRSLEGNWEGTVQRIELSKLEKSMLTCENWVPTGWVHVLIWLAIGAPGAKKRKLNFGGQSARRLAFSIAKRCLTSA